MKIGNNILEVGAVAGPKLLGGVLTVALNAILLRFLTPLDYGAFSLCMTAIALWDSVAGAAVDNGMLKLAQMENEASAPRVLALEQAAILVKGGLWLATGGLLLPFAGVLSRRWLDPNGREPLVVLAVCAAGSVLLFRSALAHCQVRHLFVRYGTLDLLQAFLKFGSIGALLALGIRPSVETLVALIAFAPLVTVAFAVGRDRLPIVGRHATWAVTRRLAETSKWFLLTFGLSVAINRIDVLFLADARGTSEVGIYAGGHAFAIIPEILGSYLGIVLTPRLYATWREGRLGRLAARVFQVGGAVAIGTFLLALAGSGVLDRLFPGPFRESARVLLILLPGSLAIMLAFPVAIPFLMFARPRSVIALDLTTLPLVVALYAWLIPAHGAVGAAWATTLVRGAKALALQALAWRTLRASPGAPAGDGVSP